MDDKVTTVFNLLLSQLFYHQYLIVSPFDCWLPKKKFHVCSFPYKTVYDSNLFLGRGIPPTHSINVSHI